MADERFDLEPPGLVNGKQRGRPTVREGAKECEVRDANEGEINVKRSARRVSARE